MSHEPKRTRKRFSPSADVFKSNGRAGFTGDAKGGRMNGASEKRPFGNDDRPTTRGKGHR